MSITSKVLLAIGPPPSRREETLLLPDGQVHPDTHAMLMSNYVIGGGELRDRYPLNPGEFRDRPQNVDVVIVRIGSTVPVSVSAGSRWQGPRACPVASVPPSAAAGRR